MWAPITVSPLKSMSTSSRRRGCWQSERTWGPGMPTLIDTGRPSSAHGGVDRVVELVVERVLVHERRDAHQRDGGVGGVLTQERALAHGAVGAVDREGDAQAAGVGSGLIEQAWRLVGAEASGDDPDVDLAGVHGGEEVVDGLGCLEVAAQHLGDALVARLAEEGLGGLGGEGVDPEVDDGHMSCWSADAVGRVPSSASLAAAFALALRRYWTPVVSDDLMSWSLSLEMKAWTRFSSRSRRSGLKAW